MVKDKCKFSSLIANMMSAAGTEQKWKNLGCCDRDKMDHWSIRYKFA